MRRHPNDRQLAMPPKSTRLARVGHGHLPPSGLRSRSQRHSTIPNISGFCSQSWITSLAVPDRVGKAKKSQLVLWQPTIERHEVVVIMPLIQCLSPSGNSMLGG